ncbi:hypothetical protein M3Y94_01052100 [Aphelenchoides besseyi]|nr:hypothetical protein M3Y94_01052100 [Aphelenchoides besseyi]KAI6224095.1 hypothetical protein M3Y95_00847100 [Aphelenchoides besseyi]
MFGPSLKLLVLVLTTAFTVNGADLVNPTCFTGLYNTTLVVTEFIDNPVCRSHSEVEVLFKDIVYLNMRARGNETATLNITLGDECEIQVVAEPVPNKTMSLSLNQFELNPQGLLGVKEKYVDDGVKINSTLLACNGTQIWKKNATGHATLKIGVQVPTTNIQNFSFVVSSAKSIQKLGSDGVLPTSSTNTSTEMVSDATTVGFTSISELTSLSDSTAVSSITSAIPIKLPGGDTIVIIFANDAQALAYCSFLVFFSALILVFN